MATMIFTSACSDANEIPYIAPEFETYENCIEIEGQWGSSAATGPNGQYGIGDPFVMRYNGRYYLYPSTSDPETGIKVFESVDMINWTYKGLAVEKNEITAHGAYAPEVVYYNGYFYMCQSQGGNGHYIYRSESPTEDFKLFSKSDNGEEGTLKYGNLGMGIDGAFYVSDDGKLYIMHTSTPAGLKFNEITDPENITPSAIGPTEELGAANLRHWIEGPGIIRRGDYSYLTYTGNHVISAGYRIAYSYAKNLTSLSEFIQPVENVTLMDVDEEHYGIGHSSNFNGPDLDSIYTAYHNLVGNGPARRYNLDRYFAFGSVLTANGVTHRPVAAPERPDSEAYDIGGFEQKENMYILGNTEKYFTAEYNFVPTENQVLVFGANKNGRYEIRLTENGIELVKKTENGEEKIGEGTVSYPIGKLNTVRIENGDSVGYVYLNGMRIISYDAEAASGALGYLSGEGVEYTAFTNDVFGTSDFETIKNFPTKFPAVTYLKEENRGFNISDAEVVKGGVRVGEKQSVKEIADSYAVSLKKGDWVKYAVNIENDDIYSIGATVTLESDAKIEITIGDSVLKSEITASTAAENGNGKTTKVKLGTLDVKSGITTMKVKVLSGSVDFLTFEAVDNAEAVETDIVKDFEVKSGIITKTENAVSAEGGDIPAAALFGNKGAGDFEASLTFVAEGGIGADFGFMLRANNYSYFSAQPIQSWQGYYLQLSSQMMSLKRYDYGEEILQATRVDNIADGNAHMLKIKAEGRNITITLDDEYTIVSSDDYTFLTGQFGIYSAGGLLTVTDFSYKTLE